MNLSEFCWACCGSCYYCCFFFLSFRLTRAWMSTRFFFSPLRYLLERQPPLSHRLICSLRFESLASLRFVETSWTQLCLFHPFWRFFSLLRFRPRSSFFSQRSCTGFPPLCPLPCSILSPPVAFFFFPPPLAPMYHLRTPLPTVYGLPRAFRARFYAFLESFQAANGALPLLIGLPTVSASCPFFLFFFPKTHPSPSLDLILPPTAETS